MSKGRLVVVGTGLITPQHITQEAKRHIEAADCVYHIVPDPLGVEYLQSLNDNLIYLGDCYQKTENRRDTYTMMVERIMEGVRQDKKVVAVFYGHPGVFVTPSFEVIQQAREFGCTAFMLPGISAEACLYSELEFDPGSVGCQSYEATFWLLHKLPVNTSAPMVLWQLGVAGDLSFSTNIKPHDLAMAMLKDKLSQHYPLDHQVTIFESKVIPAFRSRIENISIDELTDVTINEISTLYIPALSTIKKDTDFINKWNLDNSNQSTKEQ